MMMRSLYSVLAIAGSCAFARGPVVPVAQPHVPAAVNRVPTYAGRGVHINNEKVAVRDSSSGRLPVWIYLAYWQNPMDQIKAAVAAGATHIVLAWWLTGGSWTEKHWMDAALQVYQDNGGDEGLKQLVKDTKALGAKIFITTGGAAMYDTWLREDPEAYATAFCGDAAKIGFDGADFDLEGLPVMWGNTANTDWLSKSLAKCREVFSGEISAAPQSPYMETSWSGKKTWDDFDYDYNLIQYYNQHRDAENQELGIFQQYQGAAIGELLTRHPEARKDKFVVGKIVLDGADGEGYVDHNDLHTWGCKAAVNKGWRGGFMLWQMHAQGEGSSYDKAIAAIKTLAAPCDGLGPDPEPTPETTEEGKVTTQKHGGDDDDTTWPAGCPTWDPNDYETDPATTWPAGCPTWDPNDYE